MTQPWVPLGEEEPRPGVGRGAVGETRQDTRREGAVSQDDTDDNRGAQTEPSHVELLYPPDNPFPPLADPVLRPL